MASIDHHEDRYANVICQKRARGPILGPEDIETIDKDQNREHDQRDPGSPWLSPGMVWLVCVGDALGGAGFAEAQVDDATAYPGVKGRCVGQVDKPIEHYGTGGPAVEVSQSCEEGGTSYSAVWNALFGAGFEEARRIS